MISLGSRTSLKDFYFTQKYMHIHQKNIQTNLRCIYYKTKKICTYIEKNPWNITNKIEKNEPILEIRK